MLRNVSHLDTARPRMHSQGLLTYACIVSPHRAILFRESIAFVLTRVWIFSCNFSILFLLSKAIVTFVSTRGKLISLISLLFFKESKID